jgi:CHAT domain-containing protein
MVAALTREPALLLRSAATVEAVLGHLGEPGRAGAHFACHGRYAPDRPLDSGLLLADGNLTLRMLLDTQPRPFDAARLVVMSACESAVVHGGNPDEALGLPAAVTYAGARCVVGTLWRVFDVPTEVLIRRFYRELLKRLNGTELPDGTPIEAMSAAQAWVRQATMDELRRDGGLSPESLISLSRFSDNHRPFQDPVMWAGFVVVGS